jgi:hypothetical protein
MQYSLITFLIMNYIKNYANEDTSTCVHTYIYAYTHTYMAYPRPTLSLNEQGGTTISESKILFHISGNVTASVV